MAKEKENKAFCLLPSSDLQADVEFFTNKVGFKLTALYPSDSPKVAELAGFGLNVRFDLAHSGSVATLLVRTEEEDKAAITSPGGVEVRWECHRENPRPTIDDFRAQICTLRSSPWVSGKAGTHTRELIPGRLGGAVTATHIRIPNGGPVADRVHHHSANFQMVFCVRGWITLVYEYQGEPITLHPGDCVTQPPNIRHKVVETSNGLEVIEFSLPAEYTTVIDDDLSLPTPRVDSHRMFDGQRFCHFQHAKARWQPHRLPGFASCDTGAASASSSVAGAQLLRATSALPSYTAIHDAQMIFTYMLSGSVRIDGQLMVAGDAFTLPSGERVKVGDISSDAQALEVSIPGIFRTLV